MILADRLQDVFTPVTPPPELDNLIGNGKTGAFGLSTFLSRAVEIIYVLAGITFIFMLLLGAFQWITSGGEKENVAKARSRITHAIIGLTIMALAFVIAGFLGQIFGFQRLFPFGGNCGLSGGVFVSCPASNPGTI